MAEVEGGLQPQRIAEALDAPVITSVDGRGALPLTVRDEVDWVRLALDRTSARDVPALADLVERVAAAGRLDAASARLKSTLARRSAAHSRCCARGVVLCLFALAAERSLVAA